MIAITLRFSINDFEGIEDENEVQSLVDELAPDELLSMARGPVNIDAEVY